MEIGAGTGGTAVPPAVLGRVLPAMGGWPRWSGCPRSVAATSPAWLKWPGAGRPAKSAGVRRRYIRDRFAQPGPTPWRSIRWAEDALLGALPADVEMLTLAPVVPLGTHSSLGTVSQDKVLTTVRASEVAADPTNALALEAAVRRPGLDRATTVRLPACCAWCGEQFQSAGAQAHFTLFGLATAGRDEGSYRFERSALAEHLRFAVAGLAATRLRHLHVALTPLSEAGERIAAAVIDELDQDRGPAAAAVIVLDHTRQRGRGYYRDLCFKVNAHVCGTLEEIGDGGFTDWTRKLAARARNACSSAESAWTVSPGSPIASLGRCCGSGSARLDRHVSNSVARPR